MFLLRERSSIKIINKERRKGENESGGHGTVKPRRVAVLVRVAHPAGGVGGPSVGVVLLHR